MGGKNSRGRRPLTLRKTVFSDFFNLEAIAKYVCLPVARCCKTLVCVDVLLQECIVKTKLKCDMMIRLLAKREPDIDGIEAHWEERAERPLRTRKLTGRKA